MRVPSILGNPSIPKKHICRKPSIYTFGSPGYQIKLQLVSIDTLGFENSSYRCNL